MSEFDFARLSYLILLGGAILLWFFAQNRASLGKVTQQALIWAIIFIGVIAAVGLWEDVRQTATRHQRTTFSEDQIIVPRSADGHYYMTIEVNEEPVRFVIDTGASQIVLTQQDARRIGLDPDDLAYVGRAYTANGEVRIAPVRLDRMEIGPIQHEAVSAVVNEGSMSESLLGMTYLQRFSSMEITGGRMILRP